MPIRLDPVLPNRLTGPGPDIGPVPDRVQNLGPLQSDGPTIFLFIQIILSRSGRYSSIYAHIATGRSHMNQNIF